MMNGFFSWCNFAVGWQSLNEDMLAATSDEIPWATPPPPSHMINFLV